ncbi:MAG: UvrD-helicase domain-containing protein [Erysipelotrichaceae bacterium]|nr:UvrD-helicase domain-containing protein [Erysipelotrichaceae bacterium]
MPNWNPDQLRAITSRNKNVIVSASAGAGKTTVLIERLMRRVLDDRIQIREILAMTFTEAAASEMKKRLADQLHHMLENTHDPLEQNYIQTQLSQLQNAYISTIHSFCLSIVQKYYYVLHLPHSRISTILDQNTVKLCAEQAMERAFANQYQKKDPVFLSLTQYFSARSESEESFRQIITGIASAASSQSDQQAYFQMIQASYGHFSSLTELPSSVQQNFFDAYQMIWETIMESTKELYQLIAVRYPKEEKKQAVIEKKIEALKLVKPCLDTQTYEAFRMNFINACRVILPTAPNRDDKTYGDLRKQIQEMEDSALADLHSEITLLKDLEAQSRDIDKLLEITKDYLQYFAEEKARAGGIDFDDMEHFALAILQADNGRIADRYRDQFKEIMVDEFQDSNDVQHTLVSLICKPDNVFRVGDIKQSIYGFRHAKPQLMKGLIEHAGEQDDIIYLRSNYRSKQMIVDFNNQLFDKLMNIKGFESSYASSDYVTTGASAQQTHNKPICFHALDYTALKEEAGYAIHTNVCKASYIASKILELKQQDHRSWKDFVVLVRGNARKDDMKAALDEQNIPSFIDVKSGFYQSDAVQILLSFLRMCINPHDDIAMVSVLLSALGQRSSEDLAQAALLKAPNESYYTYYQKHPFEGFEILEEHIQEIYTKTLTEEILSIYEIQQFYQKEITLQDRTNLDLLYQIADQKEKQESLSISGFLKYVDEIADMETAEAIPIGSDDDVVRVMSIHQSKGLQFPVVFLWSNSQQPAIDFKEMVLIDNDLGLAMKHMELPQRFVRTTIPRIAMEQKKNREELEEEMRILYVALTRAQEEMHIVDYVKDEEKYQNDLSQSRIYQRGGYSSWILYAFLKEHSALFTYEHVIHMRSSIKNIQDKQQSMILPAYDYVNQSVHFQTASAAHQRDLSVLELCPVKKGADRGTALHELIANYEKLKDAKEIAGYQIQDQDRSEIQALYQNKLFLEALSLPNHYFEYSYTIKDEETILHGYMDFVAYNEKQAVIIDFKSDHNMDEKEYIVRYQDQLKQYQRAFQLMHPELEIFIYLYSLTLKVMISI